MKKLLINFIVILLILESLYFFRMGIFNYKVLKVMSTDGNLSFMNWLVIGSSFLFLFLHLQMARAYWLDRYFVRRRLFYLALPLVGVSIWILFKILPSVSDWSRVLYGEVVALSALSSLGYVLIGVSALTVHLKYSKNVSN